MGRPRKTLEELRLSGSLKHNPGRYAARLNSPKPNGPLGDPPEHMRDDEKAAWWELAGLVRPGVLWKADRWLVEICANIMAAQRRGQATGGEIRLLMSGLGKMGLSPSDRSRINLGPETADGNPNPFAELRD